MRIVALVENTSNTECKPKHGISMYIETKKHKILFDLGPNGLFLENARKKNISIEDVDTVIISHGHVDHGGGLEAFLKVNSKARIYLAESAFEKHFTKVLFLPFSVGLHSGLKNHPQMISVGENLRIDDELYLFQAEGHTLESSMNQALLGPDHRRDSFTHEINLMISDEKNVLVHGCGHRGIVNILAGANVVPDYCIGGYHLFNPVNKKRVSDDFLELLAEELKQYPNTEFYTMHCTGEYCFNYLKERMRNMRYLSCGEELSI